MPARPTLRRYALPGAATLALLAGLGAAAPMLPADAGAKEIVIAPPSGAPVSFADLIEKVSPAVVSIAVRKPAEPNAELDGLNLDDLPPALREYFRKQEGEQQPDAASLGSGFFINDSGTIVTNNHVIAKATEIKIRTHSGKEYDAEVVGADPATDLAVLKLKTTDRGFSFVTFDLDADLRVGDWVVAVGSPYGLEGTATAGIVSAKGRKDFGTNGSSYVDFVQVDAPINFGNSGGPTFDLKGRVVGVNSQILTPSGGNVGIGFAIPSETAAQVVDSLIKDGKVTRGWLGVTVHPLDEDLANSLGLPGKQGAMVVAVVPDGPAARGGIQRGDVILKVEGETIEDSRDLTRRVGAYAVGKSTRMEVLRSGQRRMLNVKLAERPGDQQLASLGRAQPGAPTPEVETKQPALGVDVRPLNPAERQRLSVDGDRAGGLIITRVDVNSSLARKGVRQGDVIMEADGRVMRSGQDLGNAIQAATKAKRPVSLLIEGRGGTRYVAAELTNG